ncbi:hypothetical protein EV361DRAFT_788238 [Lentinula raphanica]|uniref:Uncharacterized protein n=1 Tax=Lentinula raphanica TaxID=153919 RepID=A0AA38UG50_9AGAR|nr:hypothetical protein F5878DRAFT_723907 [Lentinula raphanica]KAJ3977477.1 hypothetical protein EV361DRAFT_788238 [Lentinula raphanica]
MTRRPSPRQIRQAARKAVAIFEQYGLKCCLFGSLACHIYGMKYRDPKDVDLVVLNNGRRDTEHLKQLLVDHDGDNRFYLVPSRNPDATYKVLHYRFSRYRSCKVDILTTGSSTSLNIPAMPLTQVMYSRLYKLPVMPFLPLLLMKLRGWVDNRHSPKAYEQARVRRDVADVKAMLDIAFKKRVHINDLEYNWVPQWFVRQSKERVDEFIRRFPGTGDIWESLGLC